MLCSKAKTRKWRRWSKFNLLHYRIIINNWVQRFFLWIDDLSKVITKILSISCSGHMVRKLSWSLGCRLVAMFVPSSPACGSVLCICDLWLTSCPTGYSLIAPFINLNCCVPKLHYHNYLFSLPSCGYDLLPSNYLSPSCCLPSFPTHSHFHQTGSLFILADPPPSSTFLCHSLCVLSGCRRIATVRPIQGVVKQRGNPLPTFSLSLRPQNMTHLPSMLCLALWSFTS